MRNNLGKLLLLAYFLILPNILRATPSLAGISTTAKCHGCGTGAVLTWSHTVPNVSNRILIVGVSTASSVPSIATASITWGGVSLTFISSTSNATGGRNYSEMWGLSNPATGTANIVLTSANDANVYSINAIAQAYQSVDPFSPYGAKSSYGAGASTNLNQTITTLFANSWVLDILGYQDTAAVTADPKLVTRANVQDATVLNVWGLFGDTSQTASAGFFSLTHTASVATILWIQNLVELKAVQPTATPTITTTSTATPTSTITQTFTNTPTITQTNTSTITPTFTNTSTITPSITQTRTATATATPTPTVTPTSTVTRVCINVGTQTNSGIYAMGNGIVFYKNVVISIPQNLVTIDVFVPSGIGAIQVALYDNVNFKPRNLLAQSSPQFVNSGWNYVPITTSILPIGTYWLAAEVNGTAKIQYARLGLDVFQYSQYGAWPSPAIQQYYLGTASIFGFFCQ